MPVLTGTLLDETYDLGVLAGDDPYALDFPYVTDFLLEVGPAVFLIVTFPTLVFEGISQPAALVSTLDSLSWEGVASHAAMVSLARALTFPGISQVAALVSTVDLLAWEGLSQSAALVSQPRS